MADVRDVEKEAHSRQSQLDSEYSTSTSPSNVDPGKAQVSEIQQNNPVLRTLAGFEARLDRATKFEGMGVERVPEDERKPPHILNVCVSRSLAWAKFLQHRRPPVLENWQQKCDH